MGGEASPQSVDSTRLPEGTYAITAGVSAADGRQPSGLALRTGGARGRLVVDTSEPRITGVRLDPAAGRLALGFADNLSRVNPLGLLARGALRVSHVRPGVGAVAIRARLTTIRPGGGSVTLGPGGSLASGQPRARRSFAA